MAYPLFMPEARDESMAPRATQVPSPGPRLASVAGKPFAGHCRIYWMLALVRARMEPTAEDSLAEMRALSKLGTAMPAMMRMMATTMSNSMREKPR